MKLILFRLLTFVFKTSKTNAEAKKKFSYFFQFFAKQVLVEVSKISFFLIESRFSA